MINKIKKLFLPRDLTSGKVFKELILFLIPIFLSVTLQQVYTLTDTIIVGHNLNSFQLSGLNNASPIANIAINFALGLSTGFTSVLASYIGEKNFSKFRKSLFNQIFLTLIISIFLSIVFFCCIDPLLSIMKIKKTTTPEIYKSSRDYLMIYFTVGILVQFFYNFISSVYRSLGDSLTPFLILLFSTILNIGLDFLFVSFLSLQTLGCALANVISLLVSTILAFIYLFIRNKEIRLKKEDCKIKLDEILFSLKISVPLALEWALVYIGVMFMSASIVGFDIEVDGTISNTSNTSAIVGYGASNKLSGILMAFLLCIETALTSFVSQNNGAKKKDRILKVFKYSIFFELALTILIIAIGYLFLINNGYQKLFLSSENISSGTIKFGNTYLYISLPFFIPLGFIYIGRGTLQGLQKTLFPSLSGIAEMIFRILCTTLFPFLINGCKAINVNANFNAFKMVCFADPISWTVSALVVMIPSIIEIVKIYREIKKEKELIELEKIS